MGSKKVLTGWFGSLILGVASSTWAAVPGTVASFDVDENGFIGSTIATVQVYAASGGNPGGHVVIRKDLSSGFDMGTQNSISPALLGNYAVSGITGAGFDLNVFNTTLDEAHLRFRRNPAENGWYFNFGAVAPNANQWEPYDVAFDPAWSNATALANGWAQEASSPSFADLMASVGWIEARVINTGSAIVGVDNVRLVPEPGAFAMLGAGLALFGRRRRPAQSDNT
jgi:hypothetical protein